MTGNDTVFNKIANALLVDYSSVYYVNAVTNEYQFFSIDPDFCSLQIEQGGDDFFKNLVRDADKVVYEEDKHIFMEDMRKDKLLSEMKNGRMQSIEYRLMMDGKPVYHRLRLIRDVSETDDYFIFGVLNVDKEIRERQRASVFNKIANSLLVDYSSVYYVNAVTNEYQFFSIDPEFNSLQIEQGGDDFFKNLVRDADKVVYEEDKHIFMTDMRKDKLLSEMKNGRMQSIEYRLMMDGKPVYHRLRLIRDVSETDDYFIFGVLNVDKEVRERQRAAETEREREIFNELADGMAKHYDSLYYVDMETNRYIEFASLDDYKKMNVPPVGDDFFTESKKNVDLFVHPDDLAQVEALYRKDVLLKNLEDSKTCVSRYRLIIGGKIMHCRRLDMWASDHRHVIMCVENVNEEVKREEKREKTEKINVTYSQISERLVQRYEMIYYVNAATEEFIALSSEDLPGALAEPTLYKNFFDKIKSDIDYAIFPDDQMKLHAFFNKELLLDGLKFPAVRQIEYRLMSKDEPLYYHLSAMFTEDQRHLLICVENVDHQVRALNMANEQARMDKLTGTKNKNAYQEQERALQANIDVGAIISFALVVCDLNDLKRINDTQGHKAGDECIKAAGKLLSDVFTNSPVFRVGGDEFVVLLKGEDYQGREDRLDELRRLSLDNMRSGVGPVLASGIAAYDAKTDSSVSDVFERADSMMYDYKKKMKSGALT